MQSRSGVLFWTGEQILDWYVAARKDTARNAGASGGAMQRTI
jgi:hypothetical protein